MCEYCEGKNPIVDMGDDDLEVGGKFEWWMKYYLRLFSLCY